MLQRLYIAQFETWINVNQCHNTKAVFRHEFREMSTQRRPVLIWILPFAHKDTAGYSPETHSQQHGSVQVRGWGHAGGRRQDVTWILLQRSCVLVWHIDTGINVLLKSCCLPSWNLLLCCQNFNLNFSTDYINSSTFNYRLRSHPARWVRVTGRVY